MVPAGIRAQPGRSPGEERAGSRQVSAGRTNRHDRMLEDGETRPKVQQGRVPVTLGGVGASRTLSCQGLRAGGKVIGAWGRDGREIMAGFLVLMGSSFWITVVGGSEGQSPGQGFARLPHSPTKPSLAPGQGANLWGEFPGSCSRQTPHLPKLGVWVAWTSLGIPH